MPSRKYHMSQMKTLNNKGPKIELCETPNNISLHELYLPLILTLYFLFILILMCFCQYHIHPNWQLKVHEINNQKL